MLVEVQALIVRLQSGATPRRAVVGWDGGRLAMLLAVLEARCGLNFSSAEVYLNVAGGYRLTDPAADLAVAAALVSALADKPLPLRAVWFGEVSLAGRDPAGRARRRCACARRPSSASTAAAGPPTPARECRAALPRARDCCPSSLTGSWPTPRSRGG